MVSSGMCIVSQLAVAWISEKISMSSIGNIMFLYFRKLVKTYKLVIIILLNVNNLNNLRKVNIIIKNIFSTFDSTQYLLPTTYINKK